MTETMSVSVILPTYNRSDVVEKTLRHFIAQDYPAALLEVLVADNSSDGTPQMVQRLNAEAPFPIRLLTSTHRLPAVKRNEALRRATGDLVLFMNDDVWVQPDLVRQHVAAHQRHDGPVAVLGYVQQSAQMPADPFIEWYQPFAYHELTGMDGRSISYRYHWSMNLSLPRQTMLERNLVFHEDWAHIGHEDVELGFRWTKAGYPVVYAPAARGEHYHPHSLDSACRLQDSIGRGLRDLEVLIPEPDLLERYGVYSKRSAWRHRVRVGVRRALFNSVTVPILQRRFATAPRRTRFAEWCYWKIMLHHTEVGYRTAPARSPKPLVTTMPGSR